LGKVGAPWRGGKEGGEEEKKGWQHVLPSVTDEALKRRRKAEIPELPAKLTPEVVPTGMDGLEGRAELHFSSKAKESRRNK